MTEGGFELAVERFIAAAPGAVYGAWTGRLAEWWAPKPWRTEVLALELRPGGRFAMQMTGPEGEGSPIEGVVLEVVPEQRIVFSNAFTARWVPQRPFMVGLFSFAADGIGTRYRAAARHWDVETMEQHQRMGFEQGWTQVAAQLAALAEAG